MIENLENKTILITGSSSGIGFGLAKKFLEANNKIIICSKNIKKLKQASRTLDNCLYIQADLSLDKDIKNAINKIKSKKMIIDILICNYGSSNFKKNNLDFNHAFKNNFFSTVNTINSTLPIIKKKTGKIICISSICGIEYIKNAPLAYSVAKSAINNYVKLMSHNLSGKGIVINSIAPGNIYFKGSVWEKKIKQNKKKTESYIKENVPMNKFGSIDDIYALCKYLCSGNNFTNGATHVLDGGQVKKF
jgi:3-oxoacyl-[acyl-carrier protein] reductase